MPVVCGHADRYGRSVECADSVCRSPGLWLNRGKESIAVDLKTPQGRDVLRRLVAKADLFLQNLAPGAAERLGLGAGDLRAGQPELYAGVVHRDHWAHLLEY
jgi:crotonobetainyl-CoA:carnitine CoA-transferase CaiB-like acyl-CoA transferase